MEADSPAGSRSEASAPSLLNRVRHVALEEHSELALEAAGVGTWTWDFSTDTIVWNTVMYRLYGIEPGGFNGDTQEMNRLVHPDDRAKLRAEVERCVQTHADLETEYRVVWPGNHSIHFIGVRGKVQLNEQGVPTSMLGACWDRTERKAMEEELAQERDCLRTLMEHLPDKIYFKDAASRFTRVSGTLLERFDTDSYANVLGKTDFDFFSAEHARQAFDDEQRIIRTGQPLINLEEKETWPDGRITYVSSTKVPLRDANGKIVGTFGLSRDVTERKKAEDQLARYAEEMRRRNVDLEEDLEMARELQNALMPRRYPCFPASASSADSALHFSHVFTPSTSVSGDFFDILELSDSMAGVFICDVMGHGVRAALVAAIVRALVRELMPIGDNPGHFLEQLNGKLTGILKTTEIPMFASASYVVADLAKGELRYANAGHPDPLCVRHKSHSTEALLLNDGKRGPVLGMFEKAEYGTSSCPLSVQDMVLLFTDGLFEVEGQGGELYDQGSLLRAVNRRAYSRARDLCNEVLAEVRQFSANRQFSDDVCLVAFEVERVGV